MSDLIHHFQYHSKKGKSKGGKENFFMISLHFDDGLTSYNRNPFSSFLCKENGKNSTLPVFFLKLIEDIKNNFFILQLIGGSGAGKSTTLRQIFLHLIEQEQSPLYIYIKKNFLLPDISPFSPTFLLLDEAQNISPKPFQNYLQFCRQGNIPIIIGSHIEHTRWIPSDVNSKVFYFKDISTVYIEEIINNRLNMFSTGSTPPHKFTPDAIKTLMTLTGGNVGLAMNVCYEVFLEKNLPALILSCHIQKGYRTLMNEREVRYAFEKDG